MGEPIIVELLPGVELHVDPEKFDVVGVQIGLNIPSQMMGLVFDVNIATAEGAQESKVENMIRLKTAR
jgi:hypothetical protein